MVATKAALHLRSIAGSRLRSTVEASAAARLRSTSLSTSSMAVSLAGRRLRSTVEASTAARLRSTSSTVAATATGSGGGGYDRGRDSYNDEW